MIRRFMLDTNMLSYILKGNSLQARSTLARLSPDEIACISSITEAEIRYGLARSPRKYLLQAPLDELLLKIQILPWGSDEAAAYGELRARQEMSGKTLAPLDMLIAAHALCAGAVLVTNDRAFAQVPELLTVNWAEDLRGVKSKP